MVVDDAMKANSKLRQNYVNVPSIETEPNDAELTLDILDDFITCLPIDNNVTVTLLT